MRTSESIAEIAQALTKAQGVMKPISKARTANTGSYSYSYADLASVIDAVREPLAKNGLSFIQPVVIADTGHPMLVTRLLHGSGEWLESSYPLALNGTPQQNGSALTYARRYALTALLGIAAEDDDDGKAASTKPKQPARGKPGPSAVGGSPPASPSSTPEAPASPPSDESALRNECIALGAELNLPAKDVLREARAHGWLAARDKLLELKETRLSEQKSA